MTEDMKQKLAAEVDILPWGDLARHFAFGRLYVVRSPWTLTEAALVLKSDDAGRLKDAMDQGHFAVPTDDEVKLWLTNNTQFDVIVMSPFVLVEPRGSYDARY
ncbi:MAG: DUF2288 family protein [Chitinophagaceae bacterium]|nr:DUF2288 family protein [Oligoflexus sp.]